jgi:hypothetical protein
MSYRHAWQLLESLNRTFEKRVTINSGAFWVIKHGIKMSAMPAWGKTERRTQLTTTISVAPVPAVLPEIKGNGLPVIRVRAPVVLSMSRPVTPLIWLSST